MGITVANNLIHDHPHAAVLFAGNDHVIELNEIYEVVRETDDQGGLDMWYNPTYRGVSIRYNFWHDIGNERECGQAGVRLVLRQMLPALVGVSVAQLSLLNSRSLS